MAQWKRARLHSFPILIPRLAAQHPFEGLGGLHRLLHPLGPYIPPPGNTNTDTLSTFDLQQWPFIVYLLASSRDVCMYVNNDNPTDLSMLGLSRRIRPAGLGQEPGQVRGGDQLLRWAGLQVRRKDLLGAGPVRQLGLLRRVQPNQDRGYLRRRRAGESVQRERGGGGHDRWLITELCGFFSAPGVRCLGYVKRRRSASRVESPNLWAKQRGALRKFVVNGVAGCGCDSLGHVCIRSFKIGTGKTSVNYTVNAPREQLSARVKSRNTCCAFHVRAQHPSGKTRDLFLQTPSLFSIIRRACMASSATGPAPN